MSAGSISRLIGVALSLLPGAAAACDGLSATEAWVREPPPVANVAAGYVLLVNTGDEPLTIERISSDCCGSVMMHDTISDGDRVRMSHLDTLHLTAGATAQFAPGGRHLMLMAPRHPLRHGESVVLEFFCADGVAARIKFDIVKPQQAP